MANDSYPPESYEVGCEDVSSQDDYKVGPGKPPKQMRFQPGQSGNPKGRPKDSRNLSTIFHKVGRQMVNVTENGRTRRIPKSEAILIQVHNKALAGKERGISDYLQAYKTFGLAGLPEEKDGSNLEREKAVFADFVRRLQECSPDQKGAAEESNEAEEKPPCKDWQ